MTDPNLIAVDAALAAAVPAVAAPPPAPPAAVNPPEPIKPEHVAAVSRKALESAQLTALHLRDVGTMLSNMAVEAKKEFDQLADDFEQHAESMAERAAEHAKHVYDKSEQVRELRASMPFSGGSRVVNGAGQ